MAYKRILTIQDISCVGQCSMTVALPILSACGQECCVLPTAVLSTHTGGFGKPAVHHMNGSLDEIREHWMSQGITFDAILTGYLGSVQAISSARRIMDSLLAPGGVRIVDPAMADHGKLYSGLDEDFAEEMTALCADADIILPNVTEAAMMSGTPFQETFDEEYIHRVLDGMGGGTVVLTGVGFSREQTGAAIRTEKGVTFFHHNRVGKNYHGTGDMFAACFAGALMQGNTVAESAQIAAEFICRSIELTEKAPAHWYGIRFESALPWLISRLGLESE